MSRSVLTPSSASSLTSSSRPFASSALRSTKHVESARNSSSFAGNRLTSLRPVLEFYWDSAVLDRLHAPLTHYHE